MASFSICLWLITLLKTTPCSSLTSKLTTNLGRIKWLAVIAQACVMRSQKSSTVSLASSPLTAQLAWHRTRVARGTASTSPLLTTECTSICSKMANYCLRFHSIGPSLNWQANLLGAARPWIIWAAITSTRRWQTRSPLYRSNSLTHTTCSTKRSRILIRPW